MASLKRVARELTDVRGASHPNIAVSLPSDDDILHWIVKLRGPDSSPYVGGVFELSVDFPQDFPFKPPKVAFLTRVYHPNIDDDGSVCVAILKEGNWKPTCKIIDVLTSLLDLLLTPNPSDPLLPAVAREYVSTPELFTEKAAAATAKHATAPFP